MDGIGGILQVADRFSAGIRKISTGTVLLASLGLWLGTLVLIQGTPFGIARLREITGGPTVLDMTLTTSPAQVAATLDALGEAGRAFDLTRIVPLDLVFPFTYALFLSVAITWTLLRFLPGDSPWIRANLLPVIAGAADYGENAGIIVLLLSYPAVPDTVAVWTSGMYLIKSAFSALSFLVLFGAVGAWVIAAVRNRQGRRSG